MQDQLRTQYRRSDMDQAQTADDGGETEITPGSRRLTRGQPARVVESEKAPKSSKMKDDLSLPDPSLKACMRKSMKKNPKLDHQRDKKRPLEADSEVDDSADAHDAHRTQSPLRDISPTSQQTGHHLQAATPSSTGYDRHGPIHTRPRSYVRDPADLSDPRYNQRRDLPIRDQSYQDRTRHYPAHGRDQRDWNQVDDTMQPIYDEHSYGYPDDDSMMREQRWTGDSYRGHQQARR